MVKKAITLIVVLVVLVGAMVFPASAALDYNDYITDISVDGDNDLVTISIPREYFRIQVRHDGSTVGLSNSNGSLTVAMTGMEVYSILFQLNSDGRLFVDNIPNGAECTFMADIGRDEGAPFATPSTNAVWNFYDSSNKYISQQMVSFGKDALLIGVNEPITFELKKPSGAVTGAPGLTFTGFSPVEDATYIFQWETFVMKFSISSLYRLQEETGKTNKILTRVEQELIDQGTTLDEVLKQQQQTNEKLDTLPEDIGSEFQDIIDKENQDATDKGDSAAGELIEIIPNHSQGFMSAVQSLVSSMSYDGTEAKLPVPAIVLPAIPGVMEEIRLTSELHVDFGYWVQQLPMQVLKLVQIVGTIALIVYCFKELYGTIAYAMTLKGGGSGE